MIVTTERAPTGCEHKWKLIAVARPPGRGYRYRCEKCPATWEGSDPRKLPRRAPR